MSYSDFALDLGLGSSKDALEPVRAVGDALVAPEDHSGKHTTNRDRGDIYASKEAIRSYLKTNNYNGYSQWSVFAAVYGGYDLSGYVVQRNGWTGEILHHTQTTTIGKLLNRLEDALEFNFNIPQAMLDRRLEEWLEVRTFDPVQRYLSSLQASEPWGGWDSLAKDIFGLDDALSQTILSNWLIAAVKRPLQPGCQWRQCLVLAGAQEIGKTTLLRTLFGSDFYVSRDDQMSDEHVKRIIQRAWVVELEELEGLMDKRSSENLKRWISVQEDDIKLNHREAIQRSPRKCVLAATVNSTNFLRDDTGDSRFWILPIGENHINIDYVKVNRNAIWGEALRRLRSGQEPWSQELSREAQTRNKDYQVENNWTEPLETLLASLEEQFGDRTREDGVMVKTPNPVAVKVSDLLLSLGVSVENQGRHQKRVIAAIRKLGYAQVSRRVSGKTQRLWAKDDAAKPIALHNDTWGSLED